jgi:hypothetical protein
MFVRQRAKVTAATSMPAGNGIDMKARLRRLALSEPGSMTGFAHVQQR